MAFLSGTTYFASAHLITVNGASADWLARAPVHENTGLVARNATEEGEYIWSDRAADERTPFASPDPRVDITQARYTATATTFYALVKLAALDVSSGDGAPMIQLAIDTDGIAGSGEADLVAGADTQVTDVAEWEYLLQTRFGSGAGTLNVWHGGAPTVAGAVAQGGDGTVELSIPWSALGLAGPPSAQLQITAATFRATAGDQTQDVGGPSSSDALDVVTDYGDPRTTGYPNTSAEFTSEQTIDYFSQVHFNAAGEVRAPVVISKAATNLGATPNAEWIQVTNTTASPVNISGYAIGDEESPDGGEGMYQFPTGTTLPVAGSARIARSATAYFSVFATNPQFELMSTDPAVPDLISFANWGSTVPEFDDAGDEAVLLDDSPSTQIDIFTNGTGAYPGVVSRAAPGPGDIVTRATSLRDTDNNTSDFSLSACAGTIVFDGGPSGTGTSWHTAANWRDTATNADRLPTTTDHVCIPDLGIAGVLFNSGTTSVLSINAAETFTLDAGTLNITSTSQASDFGTLNLSGGTLGGAGSFTVNGPMTWSNGGRLDASSTTARATLNGALTLDGSDHQLSTRQVDLNADSTWTSGRILVGFGASITNGAGHTFAVQTGADFQHWGGGGTFNNNGVMTKTVDTTVTDVPGGIVFNNNGSVATTTGTLDFAGGGASTGSFNAGPGAGLAFSGGTQTLSPASTLSGSGSLSFGGGTTNVNGTYTHTGPLSISAGTANFPSALNGNVLTVTGGALNVNANSSVASLSLASGTIGGAGNLTVLGPSTWSSGGFGADNTSVKTTFNGSVTMDGSDHQIATRRVELNGATTWSAARILIGFGGTLVNSASGVLTATGEADFQHWGGGASFDNLGTVNKSGAGTTTSLPGGVVFNNAGSVAVPSGTFEIAGGGTSTGSFTVPVGSTLRFDGGTSNLNAGSTLSGAGALTVASGTANINGTYTHTGPISVSGGTATFSPALNNNALNVSGGTLNLNSASTTPSLSLSGTIGGSGNLTVNGPTTWSNNGFSAADTSVTTTFNGPVTLIGSDHQIATRRLELNGATTWTAARILIGFGGTLVNSATGVFTATGEADFQHWGGTASFDNLGTFNKEGAGTTTTFPGSVAFNNVASTVVGQGQLELAGGGTSTGSFSVPAGSTLRFDGGTHNLNLGSSITGAGTVRFASGTVNTMADYNVTGPTDVINGTVNFNLSSVADETHATTGTMTQSGGSVGGTDTLDITESFTWSGGTQTGTGQTVILPGATLTLTGGGKVLSGLRTLLNQGTTNSLNSAIWHVGGGTPSGGTILNEGTWNIGDGQGINQNGGQMEFRNAPGGVVNKISTPGGQASNWSGEGGAGSADGDIVASIPGWTRTSNFTVVQFGATGFPTAAQAPPGAGANFFAGGPTTALSSITQNIDITPFASAIDRGDFTTMLEGYLGGTGTENDNMTVRAVFLSGGTELGSLTLAPVLAADRGNATGFVFRSANSAVPPGTRTVRLEQIANRGTGGTAYNNAYSDNIKIRFRSSDAFVGSSYLDIPFDNDSTAAGGGVHVQHGTFKLAEGGLNSNVGSFSVDDGGALQYDGGDHTLAAVSTLAGAGTAQFSSGTATILGTYSPTRTNIDGGTAVFNAPATTTMLKQSSGVLSGSATFTINGPSPASSWTGGAMNGAGTTRVAPGATLNLSGATFKDFHASRILRNEGSMVWTGTGSLRTGTSARFENTGVFDIQTDANFNLDYGGTAQIANSGTFKKTAGVADDPTDVSPFLDNDGTVLVQAGNLKLHGGDGPNESTGSFDVPATLEFANGTHDLGAASTVSGSSVVFSGGTTNVNGDYDLSTTTITGGTAMFEADSLTDVLSMSGGTLSGSGRLTMEGPGGSSWTGGNMRNPGTTRVAPGATLNLSGATFKDFHASRILRNEGSIVWTGTGSLRTGDSARLENNGLFDVQTTATFNQDYGGTAQILNTGTFRRSAVVGNAGVTPPFTNNGRIEALLGSLSLNGGLTNYNATTDVLTGGTYLVRSTLRFANADVVSNNATIILDTAGSLLQDTGSVDGLRNFAVNGPQGDFSITGGRNLFTSAARGPDLTNDGVLRGTGTYFQEVMNNGTVAPGASPGILTIDGDYTQSATGTLEIEVAGTGAVGTDYDRLVVTGTATLDGTVTGTMLGGFAPITGVGIDVVTAATRNGTFDFVTSTPSPLPGNLVLEARYDPTTAKLFAVPGGGAADDSVSEGAGTKTVSVTLTAPSSEQITINYATADGTANAGTDYQSASGTLTFAPDQTTRTFDVTIVDDNRDEPDQTFLVNLSSPTSTVLTDVQATVTIADNDLPPTVSIADVERAEGSAGTTAFNFDVTLSGASENPITVDFATLDDTATQPADYATKSGTVTFAALDTAEQVTVDVDGDTRVEPDERFFVDLTSPVNATIAKARGTGSILDDDLGGAAPQLSINDAPVTEIDAAGATATFTVTLSPAATTPVSVQYASADGSALGSSDFTPVPTDAAPLSFAAGETTKTINVPITGDNLDEPNEAFSVVLSGPIGATLADPVGSSTITDDDSTPTLSTEATLTVSEDPLLAEAFELAGNDTDDGDALTYSILTHPVHGTLTGPVGNVVNYMPHSNYHGDDGVAPDDTFTVRVSDGTNSTEGTYAVEIASVNDAPVANAVSRTFAEDTSETITLSATDVEGDALTYSKVAETNGAVSISGNQATFTPTANYHGPASFTFKATDGTADSNVATASLTITPVNDAPVANDAAETTAEDNAKAITLTSSDIEASPRTYSVVSGPAHGTLSTIAGDQVTYTPAPNYNGADSFRFKANDGSLDSTPATISIAVTPANDAPVAVDDDSITVEDAPRIVDVLANDDDIDGDTLTVTGRTNGDKGTTEITADGRVRYLPRDGEVGSDTFTYTVSDGTAPDTGAVSIEIVPAGTGGATLVSVDDGGIAEGNAGEQTLDVAVELTRDATVPVEVRISTNNGSATGGNDYGTLTNQRVDFAVGEREKTVRVKINGDTLAEHNETFSLVVSSSSGAGVGDGSSTITINDDDSDPSLSIGSVDVNEGDAGTQAALLTVNLSAPSGKTVGVDYATADGTAGQPIDYSPSNGRLTFAPGETSKTVAVSVHGDSDVEFNETLSVQLSNAANAGLGTATGAISILNDDSLVPPPPPLPAPSVRTADLALTMTGPLTSAVDRAATFEIGVRNNGPDAATGVVVTDALPGGLELVSASAGTIACSGAQTVSCPIGTLASGATAAVTVIATTLEPGVHTNTAAVSGQQADPAAGNNSASATTRVPLPVVREAAQGRTGGCTHRGTAGDDVLRGGPGVDILCGGAGNDILIGFGGNDRLIGGAGNDRMLGGPGNDNLKGGVGRDNLFGGAGNDRLDGGRGRDTLTGDRGNDILLGSYGDDSLIGGKGTDRNLGGPGKDTMLRDAQDASLGGPGRDQCVGRGVRATCP